MDHKLKGIRRTKAYDQAHTGLYRTFHKLRQTSQALSPDEKLFSILFKIMFCIHKSKASLQSNRQTNWFSKETTYKNTRCVAGYFLFDIIYYTVYILLQEPIV